MARLVIEQLSKTFPGPNGAAVRALAGLDLTVEAGELLVLAGPSGCGKTTTMRMIAGLERPDGGRVRLEGRDVTGLPPEEREMAMVFQNHALFPHLTVRENLGFGLKLRRVPAAEAAAQVQPVAELLELGECLDRLPETLSGGQRQRVALGRAMVQRPKVFLLDEPLAHLDGPLRTQMRREVARWQRRLGATMIYVTHDHGEAMALAGRLAVLRGGVLQQVAPPQEIYARPANRFVAGFIGTPAMNFVTGAIARREGRLAFVERGEGGFALPLDEAAATRLAAHVEKGVILGVRPHNLQLGGGNAAASFTAEVEAVEHTGPETFLLVRTAGHALMVRAETAAAGRVEIRMDEARAHFFDPDTERVIG